MTTQLYLEQQLWSGNESVGTRTATGTSASSPGVPRHLFDEPGLLLLLNLGLLLSLGVLGTEP